MTFADSLISQLTNPGAFAAARTARRRQSTQDNLNFTDEDEQSIMGSLRDKSIGTLAAAGNVLDLPGSSARDIVSSFAQGKFVNPLDQWAPWNWTSSENRTTGRDLNRQMGFAGRKDTWGNAIGGFATEVLTDPLTYATFFGSALAKSGQAAKAAGLTDDLAKVAARKAGVSVGQIGNRQARLGTSLADFVQFGDDASRATAQRLIDRGSDATQAFGGMVGVGVPFMDPMRVFGTGAKSMAVAKGLDKAGQAVRFAKIPGTGFAPVDATARAFDATIGGTKTAFGQAVARGTFRDKEKVAAGAKGSAIKWAEEMRADGLDDEAFGDLLRAKGEGITPADIANLPADMQARYIDAANKLAAIPDGAAKLDEVATGMRANFEDLLTRSQNAGLKLNDLKGSDDYADYMARFMAADLGIKPQRDGRLMSVFDPSQTARADELRNVPGGTYAVKEMFRDPMVRQLKDEIANKTKTSKDLETYLVNKNSGWLSDVYKVYDEKAKVWTDKKLNKKTGLMEDNEGRYKALVNRMLSLKPETLELGIFGNHPIVDAEVRFMAGENAIKAADNMLDALSQPSILRSEADVLAEGRNLGDFKQVREIIKDAGLKYGNKKEKGFIHLLRDKLNRTGDKSSEIGDMLIERSNSDDLLKMMEMGVGQEPVREWLEVVDGMTNFGKGMWTTVWPAFHARNFVSGTAHNFIKGIVNMRSLGQAYKYGTGQEMNKDDLLKSDAILRQFEKEGYDVSEYASKDWSGPSVQRERLTKQLSSTFGTLGEDFLPVMDARARTWAKETGQDADEWYGKLTELRDGDPSQVGPGAMFQPAFHGTPHKFDKFTIDAMGSGEGAQAYGWGLYFADSEGVARHYKDYLSRRSTSADRATDLEIAEYFKRGAIVDGYGGKDRVIEFSPGSDQKSWSVTVEKVVKKDGQWVRAFGERERRHFTVPDVNQLIASGVRKEKEGSLYKVDLAPEGKDYLDWDKPLAGQSGEAAAAIRKLLPAETAEQSRLSIGKDNLETALRVARSKLMNLGMRPSPALELRLDSRWSAIKALAEMGSPSIDDAVKLSDELIESGRNPEAGKALKQMIRSGELSELKLDNELTGRQAYEKLQGSFSLDMEKLREIVTPYTEAVSLAGTTARGSSTESIMEMLRRNLDRDISPRSLETSAEGLREVGIPAQDANKIVNAISDAYPDGVGKKAASRALQAEGVRGIRFLDGTSRGGNRGAVQQLGDAKSALAKAEDRLRAMTKEVEINRNNPGMTSSFFDKMELSIKGKAAEIDGINAEIVRLEKKAKGSSNYVIFDDADVSISEILFQQQNGIKKGAVEFQNAATKDSKAIVTAFKSADISTLIHETGHIFRNDLPDNLRLQAEQALGVTGGNWQRSQEEAFASGFERYMRDGVSPIKELDGVFAKFQDWLITIYRSIVGTPLEKSVSPELKDVFDKALGGGKKKITDADATRVFREMLYSNGVVGKFEGNATDVAGKTGNLQGGSLSDMMSGVVAPGKSSINLGRVAKKALGLAPGTSWNPLKSRGVGGRTESSFGPSAAGEEVGYFVELMNRASAFHNLLAKNVDPAEAAKRVGDAQVQYSTKNFTPFEQQAMKRLMPFYSFTKGVTPEVAKELMQRPGGRLGTAVKAQGGLQDDGSTAPDYIRDTASFPVGDSLGKVPEGTDRYLTGLGLMHEDAFSFGPSFKGAGLEALSRMNPVLKGGLETLTGQSFFQKGPDGGRSLDDMDPLVGRLASNLGLVGEDNVKFLPTWLEQVVSNSPAARALSTARQLTDERKRWSKDSVLPGPSSLLNTLTGVRIADVSPGAKDAIVRELLEREMKDKGATAFERIYFRKDDQAKMSPEERRSAIRLQALANVLAKRAKDRKEQKLRERAQEQR